MNRATTVRALCASIGLAISGQLVAGTVSPGGSATVQPGDPIEDWRVQDDATLILLPGSTASAVVSERGATVHMSEATIVGDNAILAAAAFNSGQATVARSNITNATGVGLSLGRDDTLTGASSIVDISNSTVTGRGVGAFLNGGQLNLTNTVINGAGSGPSGSSGMRVTSNAAVTLKSNSRIAGDLNGVLFRAAVPGVTPDLSQNVFTLDSSEVIGRAGTAVYVDGQSSVLGKTSFTMNNGSSVQSGNGIAFEVVNSGALDVSSDASTINGSLLAEGGSTLNASMRNGSVLVGAMQNVATANLADSRWLVGGNSTLGTLDVRNSAIEFDTAGTFKTINIAGNLNSVGSTFVFNTVLADDASASDRLIVGGDTNGQAFVRVNNVGGAGAQTAAGVEIITVGGASNGKFDLQGRAIGGQYEYFLVKDGSNWYLRSQSSVPPVDPCQANPSLPECGGTVDPVDPVLPVVPILRPEPGAYLANLAAAQGMFNLGYHERHAGQNSGRAWARVDGSRKGFSAMSQQLDVTGNSEALTLGADLWRGANGSTAGVMLSSGNATSTSKSTLTQYYARGKVKGEALGVYGTLRYGNAADPYTGLYIDGSVQRAQFRNRVQGLALDAERYDTRAWQGAVEAGYAFPMGGGGTSTMYLEPQLQIGYSRWDSYRHTESNGTDVAANNAGGMFGRVGVRLSGVTRWSRSAAQVQPFLAVNWLHNRSEAEISMDGENVDARIPRSRAEVSAGASVKFTQRLGLWGSLSRQEGSGYHQTSARVGLSYDW